MKNLIRATCVAALTVLPLACNTSSPGGNTSPNAPKKETFTITAPTTATTIKQGDKQTVTLTLDRGADFKSAVDLAADAPKGLKVELSDKSVEASEPKEVTLSIEVAKDAAQGDHIVKVTATPKNGTATNVDVKVKVEVPK